jgi:PilZ domain.
MFDGLQYSRRRYIRIKPMNEFGRISIKKVWGVETPSRSKPVLIRNISPGGVCFETDLHFPVNRHLTLLFGTTVVNRISVEFEGRLVWRKRIDNMYVYGMEFLISDSERRLMVRLLNDMLLEMTPHLGEIHRLYRLYAANRQTYSIGER